MYRRHLKPQIDMTLKDQPQSYYNKNAKTRDKERILKAEGKKCQLIYRGKHIRITSDLSAQTLKARKPWSNKIQALRENNCQSRTNILSKAILHS
jgi:hypothetical protein